MKTPGERQPRGRCRIKRQKTNQTRKIEEQSMSKFSMRMIAVVGLAVVALWAAAPAQAKGDKAAAGQVVAGKISKVEGDKITVDDKVVTVTDTTKFIPKDKTKADLKEGVEVTAKVTGDAGNLTAASIRIGGGHAKKK
jgi:hypothetical protein